MERGIAQRVVATLVKPSCLIVDEVRRCVFDRVIDNASVFMIRGPSYRYHGLATHSVEVGTEARGDLRELGTAARCVMRINPDNDAVRPFPFMTR